MRNLTRFFSPNMLIVISSLAAALGLMSVGLGIFFRNNDLITIGKWLVLPIVLGGFFLATVIIPILIYKNRKGKRPGT